MNKNYINFFEYNQLEDKPSLYLALGFTLALFLSIPVLVWGILTGNFDIRSGAKVVSEVSYKAPVASTYVNVDLNEDGKVDILDCNLLIENFGSGK